ncbi:hypothetical protein Tco_0871993 [Tanacetum coccineum]
MASSLIDLNLYPDPIDNPKPIITPKIEPKSEPIDDVSHTPNPNPNPTPIATVVSHDDVADNNNVLLEYNKIQELFRTAFPAKLEQQQTFDDVTDTSPGYFRKTRMIYDSLRVLVVMEDDKRRAACINIEAGVGDER